MYVAYEGSSRLTLLPVTLDLLGEHCRAKGLRAVLRTSLGPFLPDPSIIYQTIYPDENPVSTLPYSFFSIAAMNKRGM